MAKVSVDRETCIGCTLCTQLCPACFKMGDDDKSHVIKEECSECDVQEVVDKCPVHAISAK